MKRILTILFVAGLWAACSSPTNTYTVKGKVTDPAYNGETVYLINTENRNLLDSAVIAQGEFTFSGQIDTAQMALLRLQRLHSNFILEKGEILIDMNDTEAPAGTLLNNTMSEINAKSSQIQNNFRTEIEKVKSQTDLSDEEQEEILEKNFEKLKQSFDSLMNSYFQLNKDNALGTWIILNWAGILTPEKFNAVVAQAGNQVKNSKAIQQIQEKNRRIELTAPGKLFQDFKAEDKDGKEISLSDYVGKGKYTLVDFWASWCGPCRQEIPYIAKAYKDYQKKGLIVIGVAVWDKKEDHQKAVKDLNIAWPQLFVPTQEATELYGISGIPHIILFGPDGTIIARDLRGKAIDEELQKIYK